MKAPRIRFKSRTLLALVACFAMGSWMWVTFLSPAALWHRAIRSDNESALRWKAASRAHKGQVPGLERPWSISALCEAMSDPSHRVRETATATLGGLRGPEARLAVPYLAMALKDPATTVRLSAAKSLGSIYSPEDDAREIAVPALVGALSDRSEDVRIAAGFSLALMDRGASAIPIMEAAVRQGRDRAGYAVLSLGLCGSRDQAAVIALQRASSGSNSPSVKRAASEALHRLQAPASPTNP